MMIETMWAERWHLGRQYGWGRWPTGPKLMFHQVPDSKTV
jgi:hypothetical protein